MPRTDLPGGYSIDAVSRDELREEIDGTVRGWYQELARGAGHARFPSLAQTPSGAAVTFPSIASNDPQIGPKPGHAWAVQRISANGLSTNDVLSVWRNTAVGQNFYGNITMPTGYATWGSRGLILHDKETITITGTGLAAIGTITITGEAIEVSELDFYKLLL